MQSHLWHADGNVMRLRLRRFSAAVDPAQPAAGLGDLKIEKHHHAEFDLLRVDLPGVPSGALAVDSYIRGGDLVATYPETADRPFRVQIYWRAAPHHEPGVIAAVELITSVQTSLLDVCPRLTARSVVNASEAFQLVDAEKGQFARLTAAARQPLSSAADSAPCQLFRPADASFSYVEMVVPTEGQTTEWESAAVGECLRISLVHRLFAERLEKGVILRSRVIGLWVDRHDDQATAWRHYQESQSAAPPLTT